MSQNQGIYDYRFNDFPIPHQSFLFLIFRSIEKIGEIFDNSDMIPKNNNTETIESTADMNDNADIKETATDQQSIYDIMKAKMRLAQQVSSLRPAIFTMNELIIFNNLNDFLLYELYLILMFL